jgi:O-antigen/teichoic acid export membrane protein
MTQGKYNPVVGIAAIIGAVIVAVVAVFAVLARDQISVAVWIVGALAVLGISFGYFASRPRDD